VRTASPLLLVSTCIDTASLVPPTVVDDPSLPSADIVVNGVSRKIHVREFGDPDAPVVMVMPGAACDMVPASSTLAWGRG
jgi:hypothetical protein